MGFKVFMGFYYVIFFSLITALYKAGLEDTVVCLSVLVGVVTVFVFYDESVTTRVLSDYDEGLTRIEKILDEGKDVEKGESKDSESEVNTPSENSVK